MIASSTSGAQSPVIRIGVLGCANIARRSVIPAIKGLREQFQLVAVASRSPAKAEAFAKEFGCDAVRDYAELVDSKSVDALYVPLPTGMHREWINRGLLGGKHVYSEKSIASCLSDAEGMVANARRTGVALMEGLMFQYHGQHRRVLDLLGAGVIGEARHFFGAFGFPPLAVDNFRYDDQLGGGALLDAAAYPLRATHMLFGQSLDVRGATLHVDSRTGTNTYGSAFLSDGRGMGASLAFGFDNFYQCRYEVWGSRGKISLDRAYTPRPDSRPRILVEHPGGNQEITVDAEDHFVRAFEEFHRIVGNPAVRERHYSDILLQSRSLEEIRRLATSTAIPRSPA